MGATYWGVIYPKATEGARAHSEKEERNESQVKAKNPASLWAQVPNNRPKLSANNGSAVQKGQLLGPTLNMLCAYRGMRFPPREGGVS